jgi:hypothetical protein
LWRHTIPDGRKSMKPMPKSPMNMMPSLECEAFRVEETEYVSTHHHFIMKNEKMDICSG